MTFPHDMAILVIVWIIVKTLQGGFIFLLIRDFAIILLCCLLFGGNLLGGGLLSLGIILLLNHLPKKKEIDPTSHL